jgi:ribonuclease VapC
VVVDSSAIVAIFQNEDESQRFTEAIVTATPPAAIAAPTLLEVSLVLERAGGFAIIAELDRFVETTRMDVVPFGRDLVESARDAYRRYGRGSGHAARLNFGDCLSYALAKHRNTTLLFKGDDFAQTDIRPAVER